MEEEQVVSDPSNECLKEAFHELHDAVVTNIRAASIIDTLFAKKVITAHDMEDLSIIAHPTDKCRRLLILLHTSTNPYAFIELRSAIRLESAHRWLVKEIDKKARSYSVTLPLLSPTCVNRKATESMWPPGHRRHMSAAEKFYATGTETISPVKHFEDVVMGRETSETT